jgi:signal transduction histidine kinase
VDALAAMTPPGPAPEWVVRVELRDESGRVLLSAPGHPAQADTRFPALDALDGRSLAALASSGASGVGYGKLRGHGDAVFFPIVARVGDPLSGFLVVWRRVATPPAAQQVATVLGDEAAVYMVNADGTLWTRSGRPVAGSPDPPVFEGVTHYLRAGIGQVLSVAGPMEGTPWAFVFEFPAAVVQAPARGFLRMIAWIAPLCILLGMFVAWHMSRRLTEPLHELTEAADAIASGDLSRRSSIARGDELGRLVASFNTMAAEVEQSRTRLESLVEERTAKLRAAEETLVRREKLALVGQFAASISHEIRNPLNAIGGAVHGLELSLTEQTPEVRKYLGVLDRQVRLSSKIVHDLLDLSRAAPPRRESVGVASFVATTVQRHSSSGAAFETDIPADLPSVDVDPVHAAQVIDNLLTNALQATEGKGKVRVEASLTDNFVSVMVSDTGPGIAAGNESRVFEPLYTTKAGGTGLGLALSKSLAQANGGDLRLVSQAGEGARFVFTLPVTGPGA